MFLKWFGMCLLVLAFWMLLFATLANPLLLIPEFFAGCWFSGRPKRHTR